MFYGAVSGYLGGVADAVMMRIVDILYALPYMFLVILLMVIFGRSLILLFIALGAVQWLTMARIVRGQVLALKEREFIAAAEAMGGRMWHIIVRHLLPNVMAPVIVYATLTVPSVMLQEAFLSFLGLGVQPPAASWGSLAAEGAAALNPIHSYWWLIVFPGAALALTLLALNFLGDGLRDGRARSEGGGNGVRGLSDRPDLTDPSDPATPPSKGTPPRTQPPTGPQGTSPRVQRRSPAAVRPCLASPGAGRRRRCRG